MAFLVAVGFAASRGGLRPRVRQGPRQHLVSGVVLLVSLVVFAFDQGSGLLLLGPGFGASAWWWFSRGGAGVTAGPVRTRISATGGRVRNRSRTSPPCPRDPEPRRAAAR